MNNLEMKRNRILNRYKAKKRYDYILDVIKQGRTVYVCTAYKIFECKTADLFKLGKEHVYMARGKNWDCIDFCVLRVTPETVPFSKRPVIAGRIKQ